MRGSIGNAVRALALWAAVGFAALGVACGSGGSEGPTLESIAFGSSIGTYVVVGQTDMAFTSTDGQNWSAHPTGTGR